MAWIETVALGLELRHLAHDCLYPEPPRSREDKEALLLGPTRSPGRVPGGFHESGSLVPNSPGHDSFEGCDGLKTYGFHFISSEAVNGSEDTHDDVTAIGLFPFL